MEALHLVRCFRVFSRTQIFMWKTAFIFPIPAGQVSHLRLDIFTSTISLLSSLNVTTCHNGTLCTGGLPPAIGPRDPHPDQLPAGGAALLTDWGRGTEPLVSDHLYWAAQTKAHKLGSL